MSGRTITLTVTLSGTDSRALLEAVGKLGWLPAGPPRHVEIDHRAAAGEGDLLGALSRARKHLLADYPDPGMVVVHVGQVARVIRGDVELSMAELAGQLSEVPFELASFGPIYDEWADGSLGDRYLPPGFGDWHVGLGFAAALRGRAHERLVSRRWLETGPWRLLRGEGDVSLVQFHALDADAETALEQARPGHEQLGIDEHSGFLQRPFVYQLKLDGLYEREARRMKVVVLGREISDLELLEWAAARSEGRFGPERPVDAVAFVFPEEAEAEANLARLWRYGHECWAIRQGEEVRLDQGYAPRATPPAWAAG